MKLSSLDCSTTNEVNLPNILQLWSYSVKNSLPTEYSSKPAKNKQLTEFFSPKNPPTHRILQTNPPSNSLRVNSPSRLPEFLISNKDIQKGILSFKFDNTNTQPTPALGERLNTITLSDIGSQENFEKELEFTDQLNGKLFQQVSNNQEIQCNKDDKYELLPMNMGKTMKDTAFNRTSFQDYGQIKNSRFIKDNYNRYSSLSQNPIFVTNQMFESSNNEQAIQKLNTERNYQQMSKINDAEQACQNQQLFQNMLPQTDFSGKVNYKLTSVIHPKTSQSAHQNCKKNQIFESTHIDSFLNEPKDSLYNRIGYFIEEELVQDHFLVQYNKSDESNFRDSFQIDEVPQNSKNEEYQETGQRNNEKYENNWSEQVCKEIKRKRNENNVINQSGIEQNRTQKSSQNGYLNCLELSQQLRNEQSHERPQLWEVDISNIECKNQQKNEEIMDNNKCWSPSFRETQRNFQTGEQKIAKTGESISLPQNSQLENHTAFERKTHNNPSLQEIIFNKNLRTCLNTTASFNSKEPRRTNNQQLQQNKQCQQLTGVVKCQSTLSNPVVSSLTEYNPQLITFSGNSQSAIYNYCSSQKQSRNNSLSKEIINNNKNSKITTKIFLDIGSYEKTRRKISSYLKLIGQQSSQIPSHKIILTTQSPLEKKSSSFQNNPSFDSSCLTTSNKGSVEKKQNNRQNQLKKVIPLFFSSKKYFSDLMDSTKNEDQLKYKISSIENLNGIASQKKSIQRQVNTQSVQKYVNDARETNRTPAQQSVQTSKFEEQQNRLKNQQRITNVTEQHNIRCSTEKCNGKKQIKVKIEEKYCRDSASIRNNTQIITPCSIENSLRSSISNNHKKQENIIQSSKGNIKKKNVTSSFDCQPRRGMIGFSLKY